MDRGVFTDQVRGQVRDQVHGNGREPAEARSEPASPALRWVLALVVFLGACAPFLPALSQGFVALDDDYNFERNEMYRALGAENLRWMFTESYMGHYQPLSWLTLALDYRLYGLDGAGYHLTNMLLHGLGMVALYYLALALFSLCFRGVPDARLRLAAAAAALVHGMHPLRVESVAWATERRDVQSGLFLILTVLAYVRWTRSRRASLLLLSLALFVVSLLSKAWGITLPAVLLVLDVWPLRRLRERRLVQLAVEKLWYAVPALGMAWLAAWAQGEAAARETLADHTILERVIQACYGLFFYPWKTLWPTDLAALYWLEMELDPTRTVHVVAYVFVALTTAVLWLRRRSFPAGWTAWVVFAIVVSPVLGFLQSGFQKVADRYSYLACIPFALLYGSGLAWLAARQGQRAGRSTRFASALGATALLLGLLGTLTWRQTLTWKDSETLYENVVAVEPGNYFAWHNLAVQYQLQGRYEEAVAAELESIRFHPGKGNLPARLNLANLYRLTGRTDQLPEVWRGALEADPAHAETLRNLMNDYLRRGDREGALALVESSIERAPDFVEGYAELAELRRDEGPEALLELWYRASQAAPESARAKHGVGVQLLALGRDEEAGPWLEQAFNADNHDVEIAVDFARVLARTGRGDVARQLLDQVLGVSPNHPRAQAARRALELGQRP